MGLTIGGLGPFLFEWSDDLTINLIAGFAVMIVEIVLIFLVINAGIARTQRRSEARRWAKTRAGILADLADATCDMALLLANAYRIVPLNDHDEIADILKPDARPLEIMPQRLRWVLEDVRRDAVSLSDYASLAASALPEAWFNPIIRLSKSTHVMARTMSDIQTSRTFERLRETPPISLENPPATNFLATLFDDLEVPEDYEPLHLRFIRRNIAVVEAQLNIIAIVLRLVEGAPREVRQAVKCDAATASHLAAATALLKSAHAFFESLAAHLRALFEHHGGSLDSLRTIR